MNRNDWLWLATKVLGIYWLANSVVVLSALPGMPGGSGAGVIFLSFLIMAGIGGYLLFDGSHILRLANRVPPHDP